MPRCPGRVTGNPIGTQSPVPQYCMSTQNVYHDGQKAVTHLSIFEVGFENRVRCEQRTTDTLEEVVYSWSFSLPELWPICQKIGDLAILRILKAHMLKPNGQPIGRHPSPCFLDYQRKLEHSAWNAFVHMLKLPTFFFVLVRPSSRQCLK